MDAWSWWPKSYHLVVWFEFVRKPSVLILSKILTVKDWLWLGKVLISLSNLTWSKLHSTVYVWFKGFDEFLTSGLFMAQDSYE